MLILIFTVHLAAAAEVVSQWNFNSPVPDNTSSTGTQQPSIGQGTVTLLGGVTASFATGDSKSDPATSDNSGWGTTHYPAINTNNLSAGVRFDVDTRGYEQITVAWSQRNSSTASRYGRLQYTTDGTTFYDALPTAVDADSVFTNFLADLTSVPQVADNPLFGFRIVTEWESTAVGGAESYVATKAGSTYASGGTIRLDMVTVSGTLLESANTPPTISAVADQTLRVGATSSNLVFTVADRETPVEAVTLACASSDTDLLPESNLTLGGGGESRWVRITAGALPGVVTITLNAVDSDGRAGTTAFRVTILPENTAPGIASIQRTNTIVGALLEIPVRVGDLETAPGDLQLNASSEQPVIISPSNLAVGGAGSNRVIQVNSPAVPGVGVIKATVTDGGLEAETRLAVMVLPSETHLLYEPFDYGSGSLIANSPYWTTRSGVVGQCSLKDNALVVSSKLTEDVVAPLAGGPRSATNGGILYAAFRLRALTQPEGKHGLLAHFSDGSTLRGRVYISPTNSSPGTYRLLVANGSAVSAELATECVVGTSYLVVTRYDVTAAATTLWVDPVTESDPSVSAIDAQEPARIASYGFRQDTDVGGEFEVDDLKVGLSFDSVVSATTLPAQLRCQIDGEQMELSWDDPAYELEAAPVPEGPYSGLGVEGQSYRVAMTDGARFFRLHRR
jgi:hypothetical protein